MAGRDTDCNYCKQITLSTGFCLRRAVNERTDEYRRPTLSRPRFLPRISSRLTRSGKPRFEWHDIEINFINSPLRTPHPTFPYNCFREFVRSFHNTRASLSLFLPFPLSFSSSTTSCTTRLTRSNNESREKDDYSI